MPFPCRRAAWRLSEINVVSEDTPLGGRQHQLMSDNEEHSIGSARRLRLHEWKEGIRRALPIEFVELSRIAYGY
jgi:hypothetical protein